nr:hypothetical protein [Bacteroidota bacterium]
MLGFFISAEFQADKDPNPSAIGFYKVNDDLLSDLRQNPIQKNASGLGFIRRAELTRLSDLEKIKAYDNVKSRSARMTAKVDFQPAKGITISLGGSGAYSNRREFTYTYALFNAVNNPQLIDYTWRAFARFTHRLGSADASKDKSASTIKNAYYNIQVDYTKEHKIRQDDVHKDNVFDYGYIGKFQSLRSLVKDTVTLKYTDANGTTSDTSVYATVGYQDSTLVFTPGGINPDAQAYTQQYYALFGEPTNINNLLNDGALINGLRADPVYSLMWNTGREPNNYRIDDNVALRVLATGSADIKNHNIQIGFEYEQRTDAFFSSNPIGFWGKMRGLQNIKINLSQSINDVTFQNGYWDQYRYANDGQTGFFENIRQVLGKGNNEFIDIDSYDPSIFKLEYFNADELLLPVQLVDYAGYTYYGEKQKNKPSFNDYFSKVDANGNPTREIAPFQPIYMAGFIQDRFAINDLIFNVGVRVDRFDANQKVLKDKYSLYATKTAGELVIPNLPSGIGSDYVVYVSDFKQPSVNNIIGYRNGEDWYDANGIPVSDPSILAKLTTTGTLSPYLANPTDDIQKTTFDASSSFKDYEPQITFMPRIAFSFPISDMAQFFAHYDILTQRPPDRWRITPLDYYQNLMVI